VSQWLTAIPELAINKEEISGSEPVDPDPTDPDPTHPDPVDPDPTDPDPVDPDPTSNNQFSKISTAGLELAADASDYACVTQNINAAGQTIPSADRNTWMLLIPADATYADIGFTPTGYTATDLFWSYSWEPDASYPDSFKAANGLTSRSSAENQVEIYVELLNKIKYCGFSDWTVPSLVQMQALNTKPLQNDANIKTLDRSIFKNFANVETQVFNRSQLNGGSVDPTYNNYLTNPFFWTSTRTEENGIPDTSIGDYKKYLHPTEVNTASEIFIETPGGGPYFALRAVRNNRFQRIATDGSALDLSSNDWQCVKDSDAQGRRHWSNPIAELADVKFTDISTTINSFNSATQCGFNDWRLPTKKELLTLKPIHSDTYLYIGTLVENINNQTYHHDYVWIQPKVGDDDEVVQLRMQSDYDLPHRSVGSNDVKLILVRDDIASALGFDENIDLHKNQVASTDTFKTDFDAISINTAATTEGDIKVAFQTLSTLPALIDIRLQSIAPAELLLTTISSQHAALYIDVKTIERTNNLTSAQAEQLRITSALTEDANTLKIQLDELFAQYDALNIAGGFSTDTLKAETLNKGISSASTILSLLESLGDSLGSDAENNRTSIQSIITNREIEAEALPAITLNGGFVKIAKNGDIAKTSANYGDDWRCVKQIETLDGFTTTTFFTLLNEATDTVIQRAAMTTRLESINTESLCGINNWEFPELNQLQSLNILDIVTEASEATKTIDPSIFVNHKEILNEAPLYWYKESSGYVLRYATTTQKENDAVSVSSWNNNDFANARFIKQNISYQKTDITCGAESIIYQGHCYQAHNQALTWEDAKQSCINNGQHLIEKNSLTDKDYLKLAIGLNLSSGSEYWLTKTLDQYSNPNYLKENSNIDWKENAYGTKTHEKNYICKGPTTALKIPDSPISPTQDDDADTFGWTNTFGFSNTTDYQFSLDNGMTWTEALTNPINVRNANIELGHVQVRIKALEDLNAVSSPLKSTQAYSKIEGLCLGGDAAVEIGANCFTRYDLGKNWQDAKSFCEGISENLVSKDFTDFTPLATGLRLDSNEKYWLLEPDSYPGYAYSLRASSGNWSADRANQNQSRLQSLICVN
jgi:hypothetical protein